MSTILVFDPPSGLGAADIGSGDVELTWVNPDRILTRSNLGAEDGNEGGGVSGPPVGWTAIEGTFRATDDPTRQPPLDVAPDGDFVFDGGDSAISRVYQRYSPLAYGVTAQEIDAGSMIMEWLWRGGSRDEAVPDETKVLIRFYDESMSLLDTHDSGFKGLGPYVQGFMGWDIYQELPEVPVGTRFVEVELQAVRNTGTDNEAAFDAMETAFSGQHDLPFYPGIAIFQDGVQVGLADPNATSFVVSGLSEQEYEFEVRISDGTNLLSEASNAVTITPDLPTEEETHEFRIFDDEAIFGGYLGGKLKGKTIAAAGYNDGQRIKPKS